MRRTLIVEDNLLYSKFTNLKCKSHSQTFSQKHPESFLTKHLHTVAQPSGHGTKLTRSHGLRSQRRQRGGRKVTKSFFRRKRTRPLSPRRFWSGLNGQPHQHGTHNAHESFFLKSLVTRSPHTLLLTCCEGPRKFWSRHQPCSSKMTGGKGPARTPSSDALYWPSRWLHTSTPETLRSSCPSFQNSKQFKRSLPHLQFPPPLHQLQWTHFLPRGKQVSHLLLVKYLS